MSAITICQVCNRGLTGVTDETGVTFRHTLQDPDDHEPVPVFAPPGWTGARCDACSAESPVFVLPVNDFRLPWADHHMSHGDWSICQACGLLIQAGRWTALERRAAEAFRRKTGVVLRGAALVVFQTLFRRLRRNTTGPLRPISPTEGTNEQ